MVLDILGGYAVSEHHQRFRGRISGFFPSSQARTFYVAGLSAGLRNDTSDEMLEMRQKWRLADVRLEEYCFVVLSRVINSLEEQVGMKIWKPQSTKDAQNFC